MSVVHTHTFHRIHGNETKCTHNGIVYIKEAMKTPGSSYVLNTIYIGSINRVETAASGGTRELNFWVRFMET